MITMINSLKNIKQKSLISSKLQYSKIVNNLKYKCLFNNKCSNFSSFNANKMKEIKVIRESNLKGYINYFRSNSYKHANIDPLGIAPQIQKPTEEFNLDHWGLGQTEKIEEFPLDNTHSFNENLINKNITIMDLEEYLKKLYLKSSGVEFEHVENEEEKGWLYETYENLMTSEENNMELVNLFKVLYPADLLEKYLHTKFPTFKRYSGEGANTLLASLYSILAECSKKESRVLNALLAMPHRGRLNVLPLILDYPVAYLFTKIQGKRDMPKEIEGIDDVVSHVAVSNQKLFCLDGNIKDYKPISVSMLHNPSHLEAINPVAMGKAYAKIQDTETKDPEAVLNIVIHGDSAVSAQGVIYESLSFHKSPKCNLGGTIHIVTNNQIGYTTQNQQARSSLHCTDIFKAYSIPVIHVNADDTQTILKVSKLAYLYRQKYKKDFVIDLICWRKYGHNEVDEPMFTQPNMYKVIKSKKETVENLKEYLIGKGLITEETVKGLSDRYMKILSDEFTKSQNLELKVEDVKNEKFKGNKSLTHKWKEMDFPQFCKSDEELVTGLESVEEVKSILKASVTLPSNFKVHPRLNQYFINNRLAHIEKGVVDWPGAEIVAFGSLLKEGFNVRISGQDVTRGTFSQRHIGLYDQETSETYFPLSDKKNFDSKGRLEANNSSLSEMAVMLFEYGYSLESPKNCTIWEAQFGDFVNGAQVNLIF